MAPKSSLAFSLVALSLATTFSHGQLIDHTVSPPNLTTLGNNSLFEYWRPRAHFLGPNSWLNDPMTMWVEEAEDGEVRYHFGYQYHHAHVQWGNISQGAAVSSDLVRWTDLGDVLDPRTLVPEAEYDKLGVFDGTIIPKGYKGFPTLIYTGVKFLPTGWTIPYIPGTESQNLAWTEDGGLTWNRFNSNPIISSPPEGQNVTGWRDPFVFRSTELDRVLNRTTDEKHARRNDDDCEDEKEDSESGNWYLTLSSGQRPDIGPRLLLYMSTSENFTSWDYLGPVFAPDGNTSWSEWSGNWGYNFEVATVERLDEEGDANGKEDGVDFLSFGTEGGRPDHSNHWPLWVAGSYEARLNKGSVGLTPEFAGVVDWGVTYACLTFVDDLGQDETRRIQECWTYEDDNGYAQVQRGWQGSFTFPRELFVKKIRNVTSDVSLIEEKGSWGYEEQDDSSYTVYTLGVRRAQEVHDALDEESDTWDEPDQDIDLSTVRSNGTFVPFTRQPESKHYEISARVSYPTGCDDSSSAGFSFLRSPDAQEHTDVYYQLFNESLIVDRSASSLIQEFNSDPEVGKLRLWEVDGERQSLELSIIVDNSVIEVYANDVFALTTRVYPWISASTQAGFWVPPSVNGTCQGSVTFHDVKVREGLYNAWPERPANTSVPLIYDGPDVPWQGY